MKKLLYLVLLPFIIAACGEEKYPDLTPYIYFTSNVDAYVVDPASDKSYTITGSFNAEGTIAAISVDGTVYSEEQIGVELTSYALSYTVDLTDFGEDKSVTFILTDKRGATTVKEFRFIKAAPIETFEVEMGAQSNSTTGFFLSFEDYKTYSVTDFIKEQKASEGICFGYHKENKEPLLLSPTALTMVNILHEKGSKMVSIGAISRISGADFVKMENNAVMKNLVGSSFRTFEYTTVRAESTYLFKTESGRWGMMYVQSILPGLAGNMKVIVKIEPDHI